MVVLAKLTQARRITANARFNHKNPSPTLLIASLELVKSSNRFIKAIAVLIAITQFLHLLKLFYP